jgi:methionyl-tRNA formyltransferase
MANRSRSTIGFFGTPEFVVPVLKTLASAGDFDVAYVVTRPPKPAGRGRARPTPVARAAATLGLPVFTPTNLKQAARRLPKTDLLVVAAYGRLLPDEILKKGVHGAINIHPSLLPKYRGPSPVAATILNGDGRTGVSLILLDREMDHGPILTQKEKDLNGDETAPELLTRLFATAASILPRTAKDYLDGRLEPREQAHEQAVFCQMIEKEDGRINWDEPAEIIERKIRALAGWPGSFTLMPRNNKKIRLNLLRAEIANGDTEKPAGTLYRTADERLLVNCGRRALELHMLQPEGKKAMSADEFTRGYLRDETAIALG